MIEAVERGGRDGLIGGDGRDSLRDKRDSLRNGSFESFGVDRQVGNAIGKSIEALRASCKEHWQELERAHLSPVAAPLCTSPEARRHEYAGLTTTSTTTMNNNALDSPPHIDNTLDSIDIPIPDLVISRSPPHIPTFPRPRPRPRPRPQH